MLIELHIENFAIIERLEVDFASGLVAFTGETGAGKSIIIDAVETLLGGRLDSVQVRSGEKRASIEAVFQIPEESRSAIQAILEREDLLEDPGTLTLAREIRLDGRNIARVNGRSVVASLLREISEFLIDIHGQSEHLSLLRVNQHIHLLDRYAALLPGSRIPGLLESYSQIFQELQDLRRELDDIRKAERDSARQMDMLTFQIKEIESARLRAGEDDELREERNRLANAENLARLAQEAVFALDEGSPESPAASDLLGSVVEKLSDLVRLDPSQSSLNDSAVSLFDGLNELSRDLRDYLESIEFNPSRLDQVEERLALIQLLKRKYGDSIPSVIAFGENARLQQDQVAHAEERIQELEASQEQLLHQLGKQGYELSQQRQTAAEQLAKAVEIELAELHMSGARFRVDFQQNPDENGAVLEDGRRMSFSNLGLEKVEFMIAPNPGEGFKPLARIASGGETSRLMLALKNVLAKADHVPTLIFDEIDQGIGGRVGAIVGQKLKQLGRKHQVLCITHLPQLAAFGDQHFHVEKQIRDGRTLTRMRKLEGEERLLELAQMLGGVSEGTLQSARELLASANSQEFKPGG